jgi:membrane protease YdiL (CAAX protease family)
MKNIFFRSGRLRSGWRVFSYVVVSRLLLFAVFLPVGVVLAGYLVSQGIAADVLPGRLMEILTTLPALAAAEVIQLGVTFAIVYVWRRRADKKSFLSLGFGHTHGWWQELSLGIGLVALMWTFIFVFALSSMSISIEGMRIDPASLVGGVGLGLAFVVLVGLNEELDARGYVLQNLSEGVGFTRAVVVSALYFGFLHLLNPGASLPSTLGVTLFGVLSALGYWATGRLWMPIGMHAAWNFFEGPIYGFLVSGINVGGLFVLQVNGPEWLTGGRFGPEAGLLTMVPMLIMIGAIYLWGRGRTHTSL